MRDRDPRIMARSRRLSAACLTALLMSATPAVSPEALSAESLSLPRASKPSVMLAANRKARKPRRATPVAPAALVRDLRAKTYPDFTRLVLDLQRHVAFTQSRQAHPARLVIELQNSRLSETVRAKIDDKTFPEEIAIRQNGSAGSPLSVTVTLNLGAIGDYKLLPLSKPPRLVVDIFNRTDETAEPVTPPPTPPAPATSLPTSRPAPRPVREAITLIVIDPGHGGKDPGAIGRNGIAEKDVTLQVGLRLRDLISKNLGTQTFMTRDHDTFIELEDRAKFANSKGADLFVSIHVNSHPQRATRGLEVYHFGEASDRRALEVAARENGTPLKDTGVGWQYLVADLLTTKKVQESLELAWSTKQAMVSHLGEQYDIVDHGVKTAPFYVLRFTTMPSILAEIAFISNPTEERLMQADSFLNRMAEAIFQGVKAFVHPLQTASR